MVLINFRVVMNVDDLKTWTSKKFDEEGDLEGFFEIIFNGHSYGYFHSGPLGSDECGFDLLTNWFERLLNLVLLLRTSDYVAIRDIESYNTWLQFVKTHSNVVVVSIIENENKSGLNDIVTSRFDTVTYPDWRDLAVSLEELKQEIITKTEMFIEELQMLNMQLVDSNRIKVLFRLLQRLNYSD